jgi:Mg2+ and Co2+ transporter CorA
MLVEVERRRHLPIIDHTLNGIEARFLELDDPESLQHITEAEKLARKEAKRSAWLDMLYLRNQLMSWNTCLEALYEHADHLNRTKFRDISASSQLKTRSTEELSVHADSSSDSGAEWNAPIGELSLVNNRDNQQNNKDYTEVVPAGPEHDKSLKLESIRSSRGYMRRTGAKMQARLREVIKDYNEKIRECTAGFEGMAMTTQWVSDTFVFFVSSEPLANSFEAQGETNVEIALATSQDSRHMRSIALLTMIFLPGTFFAVSYGSKHSITY